MPYFFVDKRKLFYETSGSGYPLVLILGIGAAIQENKKLINNLAQKFQVVTLDNRDSGKSDKSRHYSIEDMADDVHLLIEELNIKKANVVGISMGGRIAISLTLRHPNKVNKLVLVSTFSNRKNWMMIYLPVVLVKPLKSIHVKQGKNPQGRRALARQLRATVSYDATEQLNEIKVPVTIMHGRTDKRISLKNAEYMNKALDNSSLVYFNGPHLFFQKNENEKFVSEVFRALE